MNLYITPDAPQKFILARSENGELFLWGDPEVTWHHDIFLKLEKEERGVFDVLGGGKIEVRSGAKKVYVWGTSSRYGGVPNKELKAVLKESFPEYDMKFQEPLS